MCIKRVILYLFVFVVLGGEVYAKEAYLDKELGISFPQTLAGLQFRGQHSYKKPGLGYGIRYQNDKLLKIDIFIYDNNYNDIGEGISSKKVINEFKSVSGIIYYMEKIGKYKNVKQLKKGTREFDNNGVEFLWALFQYEQLTGKGVLYFDKRISNTYLTAKKGKFVKIRLTFKKDKQNKRKKIAEEFMRALSKLLAHSDSKK